MSMTDPIGDLLTRIRNAQHGRRPDCRACWSKIKHGICEILHKHGYLESVEVTGEAPHKELHLTFVATKPFLAINRVSTPGGRKYVGAEDIRNALHGQSFAIVSTSKGLLSDQEARKLKLGGEVICTFS